MEIMQNLNPYFPSRACSAYLITLRIPSQNSSPYVAVNRRNCATWPTSLVLQAVSLERKLASPRKLENISVIEHKGSSVSEKAEADDLEEEAVRIPHEDLDHKKKQV
jgi:hypothetical protein